MVTQITISDRGPTPPDPTPIFRDATRQCCILFMKTLVQRLRGGNPLRMRTGHLAGSWNWYILMGASFVDIKGIIYSTSPYSKIHEFGGTIRPKNKQWLAIPIGKNLTPSGVPRFLPREVPNSFFVRTMGGKLFIASRALKGAGKGKSGPAARTRMDLMYLLVKRAQIPKRLGAFDTLKAQREQRREIYTRAIAKAMGGTA